MILNVIRGLFVLLTAAVAWFYLSLNWKVLPITVIVAVAFVAIDILSPRRKLVTFSAILFGLTIGLAMTFILHYVVQLVVDLATPFFYRNPPLSNQGELQAQLINYLTLVVGLVCCYLATSFVLQTKDDVRFIIPYVEFNKKVKGARPTLVDTSALIDGRIGDIAATGIIDSRLVVPRFVLQELQAVADSGDKLKRNRGRRGLEVLGRLRGGSRVETVLYDGQARSDEPGASVDEKLVSLALELHAKVLTSDYNLNKVAQLHGVEVINVNDLAATLRQVVLPGETMRVRLVRPGEGAGQGVGYLDDGTMVVVEQGRSRLNQEVELTVTSALQTSAGRMIFGRPVGSSGGAGDAASAGQAGESTAAAVLRP